MRTYIPSILIVMLSWVGFWINKLSEPARVALGVVTVLSIATLAATSRQISVSYLKALDVWFGVCLFLVFGALVEYALVNVFVRREKKQAEQVFMHARESTLAGYNDGNDPLIRIITVCSLQLDDI